jgi:hypothetical protein
MPSMLLAPAISWDETCCSSSGVTLIPPAISALLY